MLARDLAQVIPAFIHEPMAGVGSDLCECDRLSAASDFPYVAVPVPPFAVKLAAQFRRLLRTDRARRRCRVGRQLEIRARRVRPGDDISIEYSAKRFAIRPRLPHNINVYLAFAMGYGNRIIRPRDLHLLDLPGFVVDRLHVVVQLLEGSAFGSRTPCFPIEVADPLLDSLRVAPGQSVMDSADFTEELMASGAKRQRLAKTIGDVGGAGRWARQSHESFLFQDRQRSCKHLRVNAGGDWPAHLVRLEHVTKQRRHLRGDVGSRAGQAERQCDSYQVTY